MLILKSEELPPPSTSSSSFSCSSLSLRLLPVGGLFYGVQGPLGDGLVANNVFFHRGLGPFSLAAVSTSIAENIVEWNEA